MPRHTLRCFALMTFALCAMTLLSGLRIDVRAQASQQEIAPTTKAETYVLNQFKKGEQADLSSWLEETRVIRAEFLKQLLTNSVKSTKLGSQGVVIKGAVVEGQLKLSNEKIPYSVSLVSCKFKGLVSFFHVSIQGDFNISSSLDRFATYGRRQDESQGSVFEDQFLFINITVDGDINARNSIFRWKPPKDAKCTRAYSACDAADFEEAKVSNDAIFDGAYFEGPADFEGGHFSQVLFARNASFNGLANFVDVRVKDDFALDGSSFGSGADFSRAVIENQFSIAGVDFADTNDGLVLQDMNVGQLTLDDNTKFAGRPHIGGVTYKRISMADQQNDERSWEIWLNLLNKTEYRVDGYTALASFVERQGYPSRATAIYIRQRDREAGEAFTRSVLRGAALWCWDSFVKWTVGYGRRPWLAFIYSIIVIVVGCIVFPEGKMELQKKDEKKREYSRFWYSVDLYLPVVNIQSSSFWMPKPEHKVLWHYMHLHALLGWILIPIGLAAVTGIIK
jgi:hypothetical protein